MVIATAFSFLVVALPISRRSLSLRRDVRPVPLRIDIFDAVLHGIILVESEYHPGVSEER